MSEPEFVAQTLNSRQLLALLFICESRRKGLASTVESFDSAQTKSWEDLLSTFADRFTNLAETMRFEVLEAHLMSVEDLDVYHNETLRALIDENQALLNFLTKKLDQDPRFQL